MGRASISCTGLLVVLCLYLATHQVQCETTEMSCPFGMKTGDVRNFHCTQCSCESSGFACKPCPASGPLTAPPNCVVKRKAGLFPTCCQKEVVCPGS